MSYRGIVHYETERIGPCNEVKTNIPFPVLPGSNLKDLLIEAEQVMEEYEQGLDDPYKVEFFDEETEDLVLTIYREEGEWIREENGQEVYRSEDYMEILI